jgi:hypothetical protein
MPPDKATFIEALIEVIAFFTSTSGQDYFLG